jgi:hypothetical protein
MPATAAARRTAPVRASRAAPARKPAPTRPAPARKAPARRTPATRRPAARTRRSQVTPIPGRLVAVGVGSTAGAIGGIADSSLVVRLTRGRLWIGLLATLLVGIVALNVVALGLNASSSKVAQQSDGLMRANSALRAKIAGGLASDNVESAARKLGLVVPEPGSIRYLTANPDDVATAAKRLREGAFGAATTTTASTTTTPVTSTTPTDTAATTTTTTATDSTTDTTSTATDTTTQAATTTEGTSTATSAGGVSAP